MISQYTLSMGCVDALFREAVVDHYRDEVRLAMLERIVCFGSDPCFLALCSQLSTEIGVSDVEAASLLWPSSYAVYLGGRDGRI